MADNQQYGPLAPKQTSASDIRSVIANATKTTGKGNTIATTNELEQKRAEKANQNSRAKGLTTKNVETTKVNPNIAATNNTKATSVITSSPTTAEGKQKVTGPVANTITPQQVQDAFKNPQLQPINNVKVEQINGKTQEPKLSESYVNYSLNKNDIKKLVVESKDDVKKRQSEGVEKLYIDAYRKKEDGSALTIEDVLGNANYQKELKGIEQGVLQEMVNDANTLANAGKFDMDNAMALFEKYGDLGIQMDYSKLSPQTKAQFVGDMLNNNQSTLGKIISLVTPMGQLNYGIEKMTGKSLIDYANQGIEELEKSSHKNLTDKEADKIAEKYIKELDEGFKDYYEMGKKSPSLVDYATNIKDAANMYYKHKYGVDEDQKIWKDKDKEREYNEKLNEIRSLVKEQHGDTAENTAKNALIGTAKGLLTVANMASDLPAFGKMIFNLAGGGIEDTVGSVVSLGKTAYDTAKYAKDTGDFEVQWDAKDVRQRVAESGGYENYDDMVAKLEKEWGNNPLGQFAVWSLKNADTSMDTANALGNYFIEKYGSLDDGWTAFKNDPAEVISDWMPVMQFKVAFLSKLGLISEAKAAQIINASRWLDVYDKPFELVNKLQFGPLLKMEGKLLKGTGKTLGWTVKAPVKAVSNIVDTVMNQITGITKEDRKYIRENADSVLDYVNGKETSDGIINDIKERFDEVVDEKKQVGREYETIKESNTPIKTNTIIDNIKDTLAEFGVKFGDNGVEYTKVLPTSIENKVKELYKYINDFQKKGETASAADTHYFRRLVDTLANWDNPNPKGLEADFINAVKEIRSSIDNVLKKEVPGMKQVDEAYSAAINTIKEFRQDWFNKDGTIKDTAYSKIRNLTNKGANQPKLERLEKLIPGVTEKLKSLAVAETIERATNATVGHYAKQIIGTGGSILGLTSLLTGGLSATGLVLGILGAAYATPKNFVHLLKWEGNLSKGIKDIIGKLEGKEKLTAKETSDLIHYVAENQEALKDTADYMSEKGLLEEGKKAENNKDVSKEPTLKELLKYKEKVNKELKNEKLSEKERSEKKDKLDKVEYAIAQKKARTGLGDKERKLDAESKKKVIDMVQKRAKDVGFTTEVLDGMEKDTQGYTHLQKKLIALEKNPTDTTAQHELFHAFFSVVDNNTKNYILDEAKKILKDSGMSDVNAEEWLAESFGIYAKRKMIDTGVIKAPKGFVNKIRNFFQRVYEYMQRFNGDRATINKLFDEVLGERQMKNGIIDLSDLLGDKEVKVRNLGDNGLRKKSVYHGSPADFDKFDSSHMGEGEGAQAHGWGHYVAVEERTGRHYAELGKFKNGWEYDGKPIDFTKDTPKQTAINMFLSQIKFNKDKKYRNSSPEHVKEYLINDYKYALEQDIKARDSLLKTNKEWGKDVNDTSKLDASIERRKEIIKELENIDINKVKETEIKRNLYNLDIPDPVKKDTPTGSNYWEEDAMYGKKEVDKLADALDKYAINNKGNFEYKGRMRNEKDADAMVYQDIKGMARQLRNAEMGKGKVIFTELENIFGEKGASKFLESLGYDGIHYFGGRDGEAYVIFNDDALQIKDHIRYKKKIGDKDVEITPNVKSPDQLIEKNSDGLSVMKSFISDKQAEKALNVSKDLLDKDGNPYLWTHTNKYNETQFANFENAKDSKYKEFGDKQIAWFSNSEEMSRSYADMESTLANTKSPKTLDEFKNYLKDRFNEKTKSNDFTPGNTQFVKEKYDYNIEKTKDGYTLTRQLKTTYDYDGVEDFYRRWAENKSQDISGLSKEQLFEEGKKGLMSHVNPNYEGLVDIKLNKDGSVTVVDSGKKNITGEYPTEKDLLAKGFSKLQDTNKYHYQGIITDVKNPLIIDLGKYGKGEIRFGKDVSGKGRYWSDLGNAYEFLKKSAPEQLKKIEGAIDGLKEIVKDHEQRALKLSNSVDKVGNEIKKEYNRLWEEHKAKGFKDEKLSEEFYDIGNKNLYFDRFKDSLSAAQYDELQGSQLQSVKWSIEKYPEWEKLYDEANKLREASAEYYKYHSEEGFNKYLKETGVDKGTMSMLHNSNLYYYFDKKGIDTLKEKILQTNDIVFYALNKGGYDGVLFKDIVDYGGRGETQKGGDVLAAFQSKDFKAWDNANPTDSKYISYKKKVGLDSKAKGLEKKSESNGLLAKGRQRDNGMRYKKVYHGSPSDFDKFDSNHIGEGEGAQAHGWGHYVAVDRDTAKKYAEMRDEQNTIRKLGGLTAKQWSSKYNSSSNPSPELYAKWKVANSMQGNFFGTKTLDQAKKDVIRLEKDKLNKYKYWEENVKPDDIGGKKYYHVQEGLMPVDTVKGEIKKVEDRIKAVEGLSEKDLEIENKNIGNRNLYDLEIPDPVKKNTPTGSNYIEESGKLTKEQANEIMNKAEEDRYGGLKDFKDADLEDARKIANEVFADLSDKQKKISVDEFVEDVKMMADEMDISDAIDKELEYHAMLSSTMREWKNKAGLFDKGDYETIHNGKDLYNELSYLYGSEKEASKFLEKLGYDGIHYFGGQDGEAYVIFNDKGLEIKDKIRYKKSLEPKDQTSTPEFKKWFEGSKITKPDGQPMVVYHGTADKFTVFDSNFDGKNTGNKGFYGNGFYFTDKIDDAKWYGMKGVNDIPLSDYNDFTKWEDARKEKANVMGVYLDMKKPFYWKSIKNANQVRKLANEIHVRGLKWNDYLKEMRPLVSDEQSMEFSKGLRNAGYDGVIYEGDNGTEYMVFKPNQIKSATDNIGTFDKNNPDIRYKLDSKGVTTETKLLIEDLKEIKNRGFGFYKGADWKIGKDRMDKLRKYIEKDLGIRVHDYIRLDRKMLDWIMDKHGYDTNLGYGKSLELADWEKMPDVIDSYDSIVSTSSNSGEPRYKLEKQIGNDVYHLVLGINKQNNQLVPITYYINNGGLQRKFINDVKNDAVKKNRREAVRQFGKKF